MFCKTTFKGIDTTLTFYNIQFITKKKKKLIIENQHIL